MLTRNVRTMMFLSNLGKSIRLRHVKRYCGEGGGGGGGGLCGVCLRIFELEKFYMKQTSQKIQR